MSINMNQLKNINNISCIYEIRNLINNKVYIGSTSNLMYRRNSHLNLLRKNSHYNPLLQRAWNKYGEDNFQMDILLFCDPDSLFAKEQEFLDKWKPEYNIAKSANNPNRGSRLSKEHCMKISIKLTGNKRTEESKKKQSISRTGIKISENGRKKLSLSRMKNPNNVSEHTGLVSPDGTIYPIIINLLSFCREHDLTQGRIYDMYRGLKYQHKGWTLYQGAI